MRRLTAYFRRIRWVAKTSRNRWGALGLELVFLIWALLAYQHNATMIPGGPSAYIAYLSAIASGPSAYWVGIMPLVAILIFGDTWGEERRSGFLRLTLSRSGRLRYSGTKVWQLIIMTTGVLSIGFLITLLLAFLLYPDRLAHWQPIHHMPYFVPRHVVSVSGSGFTPNTRRVVAPASPYPGFFYPLLFRHPLGYVLLITGVSLLAAWAMGLAALCVSVITSNVYAIVAGPWGLYVLVTVVMEITGHMMWAPLIMAGPYINTPATVAHTNWIPGAWFGLDLVLGGLFLVASWSKQRGDVFD